MAPDDHGVCPHCGADMNGGGIWDLFYARAIDEGLEKEAAVEQAYRRAAMYGANDRRGKWGRQILVKLYTEDWKKLPPVWKCPDCGGTWPA